MLGLQKFFADRRGGMVEKIAIMAGAVALASVGGAHMLQVAARDGSLPTIAFIRNDGDLAKIAQNLPKPGVRPDGSNAAGVDYSTTASIRKQVGQTVLDPCTGKSK
jgi:hypothetical protein